MSPEIVLLESAYPLTKKGLMEFARAATSNDYERYEFRCIGEEVWGYIDGKPAFSFSNLAPGDGRVHSDTWNILIASSSHSEYTPSFMDSDNLEYLQKWLKTILGRENPQPISRAQDPSTTESNPSATGSSQSLGSFTITWPKTRIESAFVEFFRNKFFQPGLAPDDISFENTKHVHKCREGRCTVATVTFEDVPGGSTRICIEIDTSKVSLLISGLNYREECERYLRDFHSAPVQTQFLPQRESGLFSNPILPRSSPPNVPVPGSKFVTLLSQTATTDAVSKFVRAIPGAFSFSGEVKFEEPTVKRTSPKYKILDSEGNCLVEVAHFDGMGRITVNFEPAFIRAVNLGEKPDLEIKDTLSRLLKEKTAAKPADMATALGRASTGVMGRPTDFGTTRPCDPRYTLRRPSGTKIPS